MLEEGRAGKARREGRVYICARWERVRAGL